MSGVFSCNDLNEKSETTELFVYAFTFTFGASLQGLLSIENRVMVGRDCNNSTRWELLYWCIPIPHEVAVLYETTLPTKICNTAHSDVLPSCFGEKWNGFDSSNHFLLAKLNCACQSLAQAETFDVAAMICTTWKLRVGTMDYTSWLQSQMELSGFVFFLQTG